MTGDNRKRGRNAEEESSEFMPLSKRINNLHINNLSGIQENVSENMETDWSNRNFLPSPNYSDRSQGSPLYDGCSSSQSSYTTEYKPHLDATENPFYYESIMFRKFLVPVDTQFFIIPIIIHRSNRKT